MKLGILGCGFIARRVVEGLLLHEGNAEGITSISISPRSTEHVSALMTQFSERKDVLVQECKDNQAVLDNCDVLIVSLPPKLAVVEAVCAPLTFTANHTVIMVTSAVSVEAMMQLAAPCKTVVHAVPMPAARERGSVTILSSTTCTEAIDLFERVGKVHACANDIQACTLMSVSCLMGSYYETLNTLTQGLNKQGVDEQVSAAFVGDLFTCLTSEITPTPEEEAKADYNGANRFKRLVSEQTPGGLNERGIQHLKQQNAFQAWGNTQDYLIETLTKDMKP
jgi:pyrroline-5-carboxylate reductase